MYLSYSDYQTMGGTLEETVFNNISFEAQSVIDWYTFGRLRKEEYDTLSENVKKCMYHLISLIYKKSIASALDTGDEENSDGIAVGIASQSNDGVLTSYNVLSAKDMIENVDNEIGNVVRRYLSYVSNSLGQDVLYRGLYPGE